MPVFSRISQARLMTCHEDLQRLMNEAVKNWDITIIQGHRTAAQHAKYMAAGNTRVPYHESKHSTNPSRAIDIISYPIDWNDSKRFYALGEYIVKLAAKMQIKIRWGGDWNGNGIYTDQNFHDLVHFELL